MQLPTLLWFIIYCTSVFGEIFCLSEFDPTCELELNKVKDKIKDPEAVGILFTQLIGLVMAHDQRYARNAMIPHLLRGIIGQPGMNCKNGQILNYIIDSPNNPSNGNQMKPVNTELFLDKNVLANWINPDGSVNPDNENIRYNDNLIQTLRNIAENDIKPYFDQVGYDPDLALAVTFSFTGCVALDAEILKVIGADADGCVSFGYTFAMNGHDQLKYYASASIGASFGIGPKIDSFILGFDYSIAFDFLGDIGSVAGLSNQIGIGASVSGPLTIFDEILFGINIPTGAGLSVSYNGPLLGIDCIAWGISFNAFELNVGVGISAGVSIGYASEMTDSTTNNGKDATCTSEVFNTQFGKSPIGGSCIIHEHCADHGLDLSAVACCQNVCKRKKNGICPAAALGENCCFGSDCAGWGAGNLIACCSGICSDKLEENWLGVRECGDQCKAAIGCPIGTCPAKSKLEGESCECHEQCQGYGPGTYDLACCKGKCTVKVADWAKVGYCPNHCVLAIGCPPGSCGTKNTKKVDETCGCHEQCAGHGIGLTDKACCHGKCEAKIGGLCPGRELGESCTAHTDCLNYGPGVNDVACCKNICTKKIADFAGVGYCPHECKDGITCPPGSCGTKNTRKDSETCACHSQCKGYGLGATDMACCKYKCVQKVTDWAKIGYCPNECKLAAGCPAGTCGTKETKTSGQTCYCHEQCKGFGLGLNDMACCNGKCEQKKFGFCAPRQLGETCGLHTDCLNYGLGVNDVACCKGICKKKIADFVQVGYCPEECKVAADCPAGTCLTKATFAEGQKCSCHEQCAGYGLGTTDMACCKGFCRRKIKDYFGIGYCPNECKLAVGCPAGTCLTKETKSSGDSCSCHEQCNGYGLDSTDMACCDGICVQKMVDWAGIGYCPAECRLTAGCAKGSCGTKKTKTSGQTCSCHEQCKGYGLGATDMACCDGKCVQKVKDWASVGYCPNECALAAGCPAGTCGTKETKTSGQTCSCHEQCKGFGLGLNDMACCNGKCEEKNYGFCAPRQLGETCGLHTDCAGWGPAVNAVACCNGKCTRKVADYIGVGYCPNECKAGFLCPLGSCGTSREVGQSCSCDQQCSGSMSCCNNKCAYKIKDWANVKYCPHECRGGIGCPLGSCSDNFSENQGCSCDGQCSGSMTCCQGKCRYKVRDWAGIYYCPHECSAGVGCGSGSCPNGRSNGQSCNCRAQCSSGCCEGSKCVSKLRDWAGVYYCPSECNGGCGAGSCPNGRSNGQSCSCRGQCSSGCCEGSKCVGKKRDWAGVYYCPAECRGCWTCGRGTC